MMAKMPMRWAAKRTSGALAVTLNGVSAATAASGQTNPATGSVLGHRRLRHDSELAGDDLRSLRLFGGAERHRAGADRRQHGRLLHRPRHRHALRRGHVASVQLGGNDLLSFGNVLQKDQGSPWTAFGAIQIWGQTLNAEVLFTNANAAPASTCYELWVDPFGRLRVRLIS